MNTRAIAIGLGTVAIFAAALYAWWSGNVARMTRVTDAAPKTCLTRGVENESAHPGMVWVPGGTYDIGDTVYAEEGPTRTVTVDGFWMDRHEVTNAQFAEFVAATNYVTVAERTLDAAAHPDLAPEMLKPGALVFILPTEVSNLDDITQWWRYIAGANWRHPGGPETGIDDHMDFPAVELAYEDIAAYAKWKGRALPTEAQWEWAARSAKAGAPPEHEQPKEANSWQGIFPIANSGEDGFVGLAPVGCYKPNALGLYDMVGNVWEWTTDIYAPGHDGAPAPDRAPTINAALPPRVIKGGSFLCAPNYCMRYRAGSRQAQEADLGSSHLGFRTILLAPGP